MHFLLTALLSLLVAVVCRAQSVDDLALQSSRWQSAQVDARRLSSTRLIVARIEANRSRYQTVAGLAGVPWQVIAGLHNMESSGSFRHHLHEGSPLTGRTRWVPVGRPKTGTPPFTWEESAVDALRYDVMETVRWEDLARTLYACERYNGTGYLRFHRGTPTPYLWAGTTIERPGKYVADGKWSSTARSSQTGVAAIWKVMHFTPGN